ncbi:excalibur calcium-binding domain-containing protein [Nocardia amamiensis]|uniref:excalibur calcium-binding domain-containing protein n=1 Tax=Nocardia amamiensis TaxID=404578 RepID=UPI000A0679CF|nr:excalibur calcium-binding domain-containing protein [Nocardia amamiensis]
MSNSVLRLAPAIGAAVLAAGACVFAPPAASAVPQPALAITAPHDDHPIPPNRTGPKGNHTVEEPEQPSQKIYTNCDQVRAEGVGPLYRGQPGFNAHLDRDGDGIACN